MTSRTYLQVEKALARTSAGATNKGKHKYLSCRYQPFNGTGALSHVPDGLGQNIMTRDFRNRTILSCPTGKTTINIMPTFPIYGSVTHRTSDMVVNGETVKAGSTYPLTVPNFSTNATLLVPAEQDIIRSRLVTVGWRLYYTGPASQCQGTLVAKRKPISLDDTPRNNNTSIVYLDYNTGTLRTVAANTVRVVTVDTPNNSSQISMTDVVTRPEGGLTGILKRVCPADSHQFKPYWAQPVVPVYDDVTESSAKTALFGSVTQSPNGICLFDSSFDGEQIDIETDTPIPLTLEVLTCLQSEHGPDFVYIAATKDAGPKDIAILNADNKLAAETPHATNIGSQGRQANLRKRPTKRKAPHGFNQPPAKRRRRN